MLTVRAAPEEKPAPKTPPAAGGEAATKMPQKAGPNELTPPEGRKQAGAADATKPAAAEEKKEETPKGRYIRQVTGQVEKKWHAYRKAKQKDLTYGALKVVFYVTKQGKVEGLRVINDKDSNAMLTELTLQAIRDAEIPPMPDDVIPLLPKDDLERLKIEYDVLIY
ncbi:hypothetical protein [Prosthecobacter sp.]|uniref:hypothetical protein n=1 Tax=Prosthecobacter sp. TaxID=1965333 RepID=UPI003784C27E